MNIKTALLGFIGSVVVAASAHAEIPLFSIGSTAGVVGASSDWTPVSFSALSAIGPAVVSYQLLAEETLHAATQTFSVNGTTVFAGSAGPGAIATSNGAITFTSLAFDSHAASLQHVSTTTGNTPTVDHSGEYMLFESKSDPTTFAVTYEDDFRTMGGGDFNDMTVRMSVAAVPEPETYAMMVAGLAALGVVSRRRRAS